MIDYELYCEICENLGIDPLPSDGLINSSSLLIMQRLLERIKKIETGLGSVAMKQLIDSQ